MTGLSHTRKTACLIGNASSPNDGDLTKNRRDPLMRRRQIQLLDRAYAFLSQWPKDHPLHQDADRLASEIYTELTRAAQENVAEGCTVTAIPELRAWLPPTPER